jgi:hypothetical protein
MRRASDRLRRRLPLLLLLIVAASSAALAQNQPTDKRVNQNAKAIADFQEEVQEYLELHEKLERTLPDLPREPTPEDLDRRQRALAALIQKARRSAKQGDIFERDVRPLIRRLLYGVFTGPDGQHLRAAIKEENPADAVKLQVNGRYPDTFPLSTVPAQVLKILPPLPKDLEYRFIDTTLILHDVHAHIIVDYMTGAVPR